MGKYANGTDYSRNVGTNLNNRNVFKKLIKQSEDIVEEVMEDRFHAMVFTLRNSPNQELKVNNKNFGVFPLSEKPSRNGHASKSWQSIRKGKTKWSLYNDHRNPNDEYPYVRNLAYGTGWNFRVPTKKVNSLGFSTQMPKGLHPWFKEQQLKMKDIMGAKIAQQNRQAALKGGL